MLTFKRALVVACVVLTFFILLKNTHNSDPAPLVVHNSPKPTGSYSDNKKIQMEPPENAVEEQPIKPAPSTKEWNGDNGGRALVRKPKPQVPLGQLNAEPLRKQLSYIFPYDSESKFPAYIWQTWKYTPADGKFGEEFRPAEASWSELHPSFVHEVITDSTLR